MRILQVVPYFYPGAYGGPGKSVYNLSVSLVNGGHTVTVYTSDCYDEHSRMPKTKRGRISGIVVRYFSNISNYLAFRHHIFLPLAYFWQCAKELPFFDLIHIHDFYTLPNVWTSWLCRIYRKPYVLTAHGSLSPVNLEQKTVIKRVFLRLFGFALLRHATCLIALSEQEKKAYMSYGIPPSNVAIVGHGIDGKEFIVSETKHQSRTHFHLPENNIVVTFLGRLDKIKGLDLLIGALVRIREKFGNLKTITCVIAGPDYGFRGTLKRLISRYGLASNVRLMPACFGKEKNLLLKATDIFVQPSYSEGLSLAILEAAGVGLPLVITTTCHFGQIGARKAGIVVSPTVEALAEGLEELIQSPDERRRYGENASSYIAKEFSLEKVGIRHAAIYRHAIKTYEKLKSDNIL